jgi:hypothetical protein
MQMAGVQPEFQFFALSGAAGSGDPRYHGDPAAFQLEMNIEIGTQPLGHVDDGSEGRSVTPVDTAGGSVVKLFRADAGDERPRPA